MSDPSTPPTIDLGKFAVELIEPPALFSIACSRDAKRRKAGGHAEDLAFGAAALRMCWPPKKAWPVKVRPGEWGPGTRMGAYGGDIFEALRRGTKGSVPMASLQTACFRALTWALSCSLTEDEIRAAVDFSEGQEE